MPWGGVAAASHHSAQLRAVPAANPHQPGDLDLGRQVSVVIERSTMQFVPNYSIGLIVFLLLLLCCVQVDVSECWAFCYIICLCILLD